MRVMWLGLLLGFCVFSVFSVQLASAAVTERLVTTVPIEIPKTEKGSLKEHPIKAEDLYPVFNKGSLGLRMEAIRQGALSLPNTEKDKLLAYLAKRRALDNNNPTLYFDYGYAQIVLRNNKSGLFFLRKANDHLKNPYASIAYAMAQADIDLTVEGVRPDSPSIRKLDVVYKLDDAVALDVKHHTPGFWPTFVRIQQQLAKYPAYADFSSRDYSDAYVPFGIRSQPLLTSTMHTSQSLSGCGLQPAPLQPKPVFTQSISLLGTASPQTLQFIRMESPLSPVVLAKPVYTIRVVDGRNQLLGNVESRVGASVVEDLERDGTFELVLRQFRVEPLHPVRVYRFKQCQFQLDERVDQLFE